MELIIYCITYPIEAFILWHYCSNMFFSKRHKNTQILILTLLYALMFCIASVQNVFINMISFTILNFLYIILCYDIRWYFAFFHTSVLSCTMGLLEVVVLSIFSNLFFHFYKDEMNPPWTIILVILSKLLYFFALHIIIHYYSRSREEYLDCTKDVRFLILIPLITSWVISTLAYVCITIRLPLTLQIFITISALLLLVINFLIFSIYRYNRQKEGEYTAMRLQLQKEYDAVEYYQMLLAEEENKSILLHDIKKHLSTLSLLNQQGAYDKMGVYMENLLASPALQPSVKICDSDLLNAILFRYIRVANEKKISLHADIRSNSLSFLSNDDLTTLFCNLLDNAMDAVLQTEDGSIELCVQSKTFTVITLTNTCRVNPYDAHGALPTRKADKLHHGYGLKSIARIVEKYCGSMKNYYDRETCTFHTIIMLKNTEKTTR